MVRFKITSVDRTMPGTLLLSETWFITIFPFTGAKISLPSPCLDQRTGGRGNPITVQVKTANADWLRTKPVGKLNAVTLGWSVER